MFSFLRMSYLNEFRNQFAVYSKGFIIFQIGRARCNSISVLINTAYSGSQYKFIVLRIQFYLYDMCNYCITIINYLFVKERDLFQNMRQSSSD